MKGDPKVLEALERAAAHELAAAVQYRLNERDLRYQGLKTLARKFCKFGGNSEDYLEEITDRILLLGGDPAYAAARATTASSLTETLQKALDAETAMVSDYNLSVALAVAAGDDNTRNKFEHWIKWHEDGQIDWLERQLAQIRSLGESEYIKIQLGLS